MYEYCIEDTYYLYSILKVQMMSPFSNGWNFYIKTIDNTKKKKKKKNDYLISLSWVLISPSSLT